MKRSNQQPYRLIYRRRGRGAYYCVDTRTGKRESLGKVSRLEAEKIVAAKIEAQRQPALNIQLAKAYLCAWDPGLQQRTWQQALEALTQTKHGANKERWERAAKDRALAPLLLRVIVETDAAAILDVLRHGTVSTNVFLRRLYNFCVDMNWLHWPLMPKRQCPAQDTRTRGPSRGTSIAESSNASRTRSAKPTSSLRGISGPLSRTSPACGPRISTGLTKRSPSSGARQSNLR